MIIIYDPYIAVNYFLAIFTPVLHPSLPSATAANPW